MIIISKVKALRPKVIDVYKRITYRSMQFCYWTIWLELTIPPLSSGISMKSYPVLGEGCEDCEDIIKSKHFT